MAVILILNRFVGFVKCKDVYVFDILQTPRKCSTNSKFRLGLLEIILENSKVFLRYSSPF